MHRGYKSGLADNVNTFKEFVLPSGKRIDFLDVKNGIIYELKPNNPRAILEGKRQLKVYMDELKVFANTKGYNGKPFWMYTKMRNNEFRKLFGKEARANGFESAHGGWLKMSDECIVVLDLQKSNFGNYFQLMIKIYVQGMFGMKYSKSKDLVKRQTGDVFRGEPPRYRDVFDFDGLMDDEKRKKRLAEMFIEFVGPFTDKALSRSGLKKLAAEEQVFLLPAVEAELT